MSAPAAAPPRRGSATLVTAIALALLAAVAVTIMRGSYRDGPLEPDAPTPQGSRAVVRVLEDLGTDVEVRRHTQDAAEQLRAGSTVLVTDPGRLSSAQLEALQDARADGSGRLVLLRPDAITLGYFPSTISPADALRERERFTADADCGAAAFGARSAAVLGEESEISPSRLYRSGAGASCFGRDGAGLVAVDEDLIVLGSPDVLTNQGVGEADDSALALNLLGADGELTWYIPSAADPMAGTGGQSLLDRLPPWAGPVAGWLVLSCALLVLALFPRLGPVVVEPLPVAVRAQELVLGRARMLQRARASSTAAASLRAAAAARLADRLGLRRATGLDALLAALAPHTRRSPAQLRELLADAPVRTDGELVRLASDLDDLEKEIDR